jgi:hypothetical protein
MMVNTYNVVIAFAVDALTKLIVARREELFELAIWGLRKR